MQVKLYGVTIIYNNRMRDLSNQEKHESQKLLKQNEKVTLDMNQLKKDKERLTTEVSELQEQMIELKEQVMSKQCFSSLPETIFWI